MPLRYYDPDYVAEMTCREVYGDYDPEDYPEWYREEMEGN